jgi:chromosome partitioning protein
VPTISFASSKGGAGKSTSAVLLATEIAVRGTTVTLLDADPNQPVSRWGRKPGRPEGLRVMSDITEESLIEAVEHSARETAFVIVDLEGTASLLVAQAMSRSDLVVIPCKGSVLDANEAVKAIKFIRRQEKAYSRTIPFALLFTQTNPAVRPRTLRSLEDDMAGQGVPMFHTAIHERDAYRALFAFGGTLYGLDPQLVRNLDAAIRNVRAFTAEVIAMLAPAKEAAIA